MPRSLLTAMDNSVGAEHSVSLSTSAVTVAESNPDRLALYFPPCPTGSYFVSTDPNIAQGTGIAIVAAGVGLTLTKELHGGLVNRQWYGIASSARVFGVFEALDTHAPQREQQ